jgi:hypothetical protein
VAEPVAAGPAARREAAAWPEAAPKSDEVWHVVFRDDHGRPHTISGTAADIHTWVEQGLLSPAGAKVSRDREGPFTPLTHAEEFRGLGAAPAPRPPHHAPAMAPPSGDALPPTRPSLFLNTEKATPEPAATPRSSEWLTWLVPIVLALLCALLIGQKLFW